MNSKKNYLTVFYIFILLITEVIFLKQFLLSNNERKVLINGEPAKKQVIYTSEGATHVKDNFNAVKDGGGEHVIENLTCQEPHLVITGRFGEMPPPLHKDYFAPIESVWAALNQSSLAPTKKKARLYIIKHRDGDFFADGVELVDDSGGYESVVLEPGSGKFLFEQVWDRPKVQEKGYDVVVDFEPFGIYNKGFDIIDTGEKGGFYVPKHWLCLNSLCFNHTRNAVSGDALTIRLSKKKVVRTPEWKRGQANHPAAYAANRQVTVRVEFRAAGTLFQADIEARARRGKLENLKRRFILFDKHGIAVKHFLLLEDTPAEISAFNQVWDWYLYGLKVKGSKFREFAQGIHIATTINKIYVVLSLPQCPWAINGTYTPWSRVLEFSTHIAHGESKPEAAAGKITRFFYEGIGAAYTNQPHYSPPNPSGGFELIGFMKKMLLERYGKVGEVNCYDMAKAVVIFSNSLGCDLHLRYFESSDKNSLQLRCVQKVGCDWECGEKFRNHAFAILRDKIFDASLRADGRGGSYDNSSFIPEWMINVSWNDYKKKVLKGGRPTYPEVILFKIFR